MRRISNKRQSSGTKVSLKKLKKELAVTKTFYDFALVENKVS